MKYKEARLIPRGLSPLAFHGSAKPHGVFFFFFLVSLWFFLVAYLWHLYTLVFFLISNYVVYPAILLLNP